MLQHKILGLDVGSRTVETAVSDIIGWTAQGSNTLRINEKSNEPSIDQLIDIIKGRDMGTVIVGLPEGVNNSVGFRGETSLTYKERLLEAYPSIEVMMWDERLSTTAAERSLLEADVSRQKRKQVTDRMTAVLILQDYLDLLH